ncbi:MAG: hypothetical protein QOG54_792 [Actinomycetota bacterium]|nr:hypothetical protein [Actinomycetota bacterium]
MSALKKLAAKAKLTLERSRARFGFVDVTVRVFKRFGINDGGSHAAALTYFTFFSIFPLMLFCASLLGFLTEGNQALREDLIRQGVKTIPLLRDALSPDGVKFIIERRSSLLLTGLALSLYSGSGAIVALQHALNRFHGITDEPNWIQKRLRSLKWLAILGLGALVTIGLGSLSGFSAEIFGKGSTASTLVGIAAFFGGVVVNTLIFATAFKFLPAAEQSWREVLPGALVAAIAFAGLQVGGTAYLARGSQARNDTFGTFAGAATLLVASYLLAQITLLAAEVNLVLQERKRLRTSSLAYEEGGGMTEIPTIDTPYQGNGHKEKSAGQLMKEVTEDLSTLVRKEIELAKQELGQSVAAKAKGAAIIAVAGAIGFFALIFMLLAIRDGFDTVFVTWFADILTAVVLLVIAGLAGFLASKKLKTPISTEMTKKTIKEDVEWAKTLGRR